MNNKQYIGLKIQALLDAKGLKQKSLAAAIKVGERHLSKKIGKESAFSHAQVVSAAEFLGVTVDYLRDGSRPFNLGDTIDMIPPDAILAPPTPAPDIDPMAALLSELLHRKTENRERFGFEAMEKQMERLTAELGSVVEELRLTREELKKNREGFDGEHDPD